ncbi:Uncharacterized protein PBTT_00595 [Plasmodiophora brassicae]
MSGSKAGRFWQHRLLSPAPHQKIKIFEHDKPQRPSLPLESLPDPPFAQERWSVVKSTLQQMFKRFEVSQDMQMAILVLDKRKRAICWFEKDQKRIKWPTDYVLVDDVLKKEFPKPIHIGVIKGWHAISLRRNDKVVLTIQPHQHELDMARMLTM